MIKGAIFDVDGTIIDSMPMWMHFAGETVASFGLVPEDGLDHKVRYFSLRQTAEYIAEKYPSMGNADSIEALCMERTKDFYAHTVALKAGAAELIKELSHRDIGLYIATATYRPLVEAALTRLGVLDSFEGLVTCAEVGAGKDRPDVFYRAAGELAAEPRNIWVFEDAMHAMLSAKSAGFNVCGIYDATENDHKEMISEICDIYVNSFTELNTELLFKE